MGVLEGRVAAITGGGWGAGLAIARRFVAEGAYVFITGRDEPRLRRAAESIGHLVTSVLAAPSDPADLDFLYNEIRETAGYLDILVAASAMHPTTPIPQVTPDAFAALDAAETQAAYRTVQGALPVLRRSGAVVLIGAGAQLAFDHRASATLRNVAHAWSADLAERRTRISVISAPGADIWEPHDGACAVEPLLIDEPAPATAELSERIASAATLLASHTASYLASAEVSIAVQPAPPRPPVNGTAGRASSATPANGNPDHLVKPLRHN